MALRQIKGNQVLDFIGVNLDIVISDNYKVNGKLYLHDFSGLIGKKEFESIQDKRLSGLLKKMSTLLSMSDRYVSVLYKSDNAENPAYIVSEGFVFNDKFVLEEIAGNTFKIDGDNAGGSVYRKNMNSDSYKEYLEFLNRK